MTLRTPLAIAVVLIIYGCTFVPGDEFYQEVAKPIPRVTTIDFFSQTDTFLVRGPVGFAIQPHSQDEILSYRLLLDDVELDTGAYPSYLQFQSDKYADGSHILLLKMTKRGTGGSIGAQLGLETYEEVLSRNIFIYNKEIEAPQLRTRIEGGELFVEWDAYKGPSFISYEISNNLTSAVTITDQQVNTLKIPDYVGGDLTFYFELRAFDVRVGTGMSYEWPFNATFLKNDLGINLTWNQSPFKNWKGAKIVINIGNSVQEIAVDANTTQFQLPTEFVFPYDISIALMENSNTNPLIIASKTYSTSYNPLWWPGYFDALEMIPSETVDTLSLLFFSEGFSNQFGHLYLMNTETREPIGPSRLGYFGLSKNGKYLFEYTGDKLTRINPSDLETVYDIGFHELGISPSRPSYIFVSDENKVLLYYDVSGEDSYYVIDGSEKKLLFSGKTLKSRPLYANGSLTNDGRKFYQSSGTISLDIEPKEYSWFSPDTRLELPLSHLDRIIWWDDSFLIEKDNYRPYDGKNISYSKQIISLFSNRNNQFGVAYIEDNKIKIDFFENGSLALLSTLETSLDPGRTYSFKLINDYLQVRENSYGVGLVQQLKIDF